MNPLVPKPMMDKSSIADRMMDTNITTLFLYISSLIIYFIHQIVSPFRNLHSNKRSIKTTIFLMLLKKSYINFDYNDELTMREM